jgi:putative thioredoxin
VRRRGGEVELVKVDTDANQMVAAAFGIRGIPAVKAFKDAQVVDEFVGAIPPPQIEAWLDRIVPSPADRLADAEDEASLREALSIDPRHAEAANKLGRILVGRGDYAEAIELLDGFRGDFVAEGLVARGRLASELGNGAADESGVAALLSAGFAAWDDGDRATTLERLQEAIGAEPDSGHKDLIRRVMVAIFTELGADDPLAREHRRRLAATLT